jgi:hypothetical protein
VKVPLTEENYLSFLEDKSERGSKRDLSRFLSSNSNEVNKVELVGNSSTSIISICSNYTTTKRSSI